MDGWQQKQIHRVERYRRQGRLQCENCMKRVVEEQRGMENQSKTESETVNTEYTGQYSEKL